MVQLDPTRLRLRLLRAVADGHIWRGGWGDNSHDVDSAGLRARIDVRLAELCDAGWVELGHATNGQWRRWDVTDAGRAVLKEDEEGSTQ